MKRPTFMPRLATDGGRRIRRTPKADRIAAQPATEAARLMRSLIAIRSEAEGAQKRADRAVAILERAFLSCAHDDPIVTRALAREALIECRFAGNFALLIRYCEMAEEGTLCA
ncbi:hypothetical protein [Methylobacterium sp. WL6]|uniref:hypothetical protein n=1 Tax=Methylobacterium sp. WL6 TaxID=2603901 RepID=UPI0011CAE822|nr:hypothetical protein [Methylobacterium sp. WL6]TXN67881.1 hypothetical protein FV230_13765 [Methylobacterium sp. WL6]